MVFQVQLVQFMWGDLGKAWIFRRGAVAGVNQRSLQSKGTAKRPVTAAQLAITFERDKRAGYL